MLYWKTILATWSCVFLKVTIVEPVFALLQCILYPKVLACFNHARDLSFGFFPLPPPQLCWMSIWMSLEVKVEQGQRALQHFHLCLEAIFHTHGCANPPYLGPYLFRLFRKPTWSAEPPLCYLCFVPALVAPFLSSEWERVLCSYGHGALHQQAWPWQVTLCVPHKKMYICH